MQPFEKLGAFYLGKEYDLAKGQILDSLVMYDARDLTTHAVCVGMTGSGKTGLCIDLLEEAAIDNVPAILIDPKGDLTNMLLTFPELRPEDFQPWINVDDARRKEMSVEEYAKSTAESWKKGLADWGEGPERIRMLKESADFAIYTPGSDAGLPVSILASLSAPGLSWDEEQELLREQIQGTVGALLGLVGIEADPLQSREHILLSNIFEHFWRRGEDLDLTRLITAIQSPPVRQIGVFDVDTFFPEKDRFGLAMSLNNIIAAPGFQAWLEGEPLDPSHLLYTPEGKPRHSIFYIAHLSDAERMFFVTLLLEQVVTWVRQQSGTTSLRALLYFDEVFGFFPPVAEPPSKRPLLTLLKQARAFGFGVVLTTQNPVDLDYKGLTNAGTWFIGTLQTERDKMRVLDGLESASAAAGGGLKRQQLDRIISALRSRVFLLHNVHEDRPVIFNTRWAMSYLRGPLTRTQVRDLMADRRKTAVPSVSEAAGRPSAREGVAAAAVDTTVLEGYSSSPPSVSPGMSQVFLPLRVREKDAVSSLSKELGQAAQATETTVVYEPHLLGMGAVSFVDRKRNLDQATAVGLLVQGEDLGATSAWEEATAVELDARDLESEPESEALFGTLPSQLSTASKLKALEKDFANHLFDSEQLDLLYSPALNLYGEPGESEKDFAVRAQLAAREQRDAQVDQLRNKYQKSLDRLEERLSKEEQELAGDRAEYEGRKREELLSAGETVVGMLGIFGRRSSRSLSTAARKRRMTTQAQGDVKESEEQIKRLEEEIKQMTQEMETEAQALADRWEDSAGEIQTYTVKPRRSDIKVELVTLAWAPYWEIGYRSARGQLARGRVPAY
jgi:DNA helicase HerA-like ATPase